MAHLKFFDFIELHLLQDDHIGLLLGETEENNELTVNLNTSKCIQEERYQDLFKQILVGYVVLVARNIKTVVNFCL